MITKLKCRNCEAIITTDSPLSAQCICGKTNWQTIENILPEVFYSQQEKEKARMELFECYNEIIALMREYIEIKEENYKLIALWIIGTYAHDKFNTFPYLFLNAMRGSGKTRLLKFIANLSKNGDIVADIREAVLFRTAKNHTIIIDEFEHINNKDKNILRELLNAGYKKGIKVKRMKKVFKEKAESQEVEEFELYTPIVMANIHGMDEVLADRCLTIVLEKSHNPSITKMVEDFDFNPKFALIRQKCSLCNVVMQKNIYIDIITLWNNYIKNYNYTTTHNTITTNNNTTSYTEQIKDMFDQIFRININGRNFELLFPLFLLAYQINQSLFLDILEIAKGITEGREVEEFAESKDIALMDFIAHQPYWRYDYVSVKMITQKFREFLDEGESEERWLNDKWLGRALKRLNLVSQKRRVARGIEVVLNVDKALDKIKIFKNIESVKKEGTT